MKIPSDINKHYEEFYHEDKGIKNLVLYIREILFDDATTIKHHYTVAKITNNAFPFNLTISLDGTYYYVETDTLARVRILLSSYDFEFFPDSLMYVIKEKERLKKEEEKNKDEQEKEIFLNKITDFMHKKYS